MEVITMKRNFVIKNHIHKQVTFLKNKQLYYILSVFIFIVMSSCSHAPRPAYMVPTMEGLTFKNSNKSLNVEMVLGGEETDELIKGSRIDSSSFLSALVQALSESNMFTNLNVSDNPDYSLSTLIISQSQPLFGISMRVSMMVRYTLIEGDNGSQVWKKDIVSSYTAGFGEALMGATRLKKANEGAVRENIKLLLKELAALDL